MDTLEQAREFCALWARELAQRRAHPKLRTLEGMWAAREADAQSSERVIAAMAALPMPIFAAVYVHYTSKQTQRQKVRELEVLTGEPLSQRELWNRLDRAYYYVAGLIYPSASGGRG
jgi:hypothetical protein